MYFVKQREMIRNAIVRTAVWKHMFHACVFACVGLVLLSAISTPACAQTLNSAPYMPLTVGNYWLYNLFAEDILPYQKIIYQGPGVQTVTSGPVYNGKQSVYLSNPDGIQSYYLSNDADGVLLHGVYANDSDFPDWNPILFTPAVTYFPPTISVGQSYSATRNFSSDSSTSQITLKMDFIGMENVTVPAGTFSAIKFHQTITTTASSNDFTLVSKEVSDIWYVANLGVVKLIWQHFVNDSLVQNAHNELVASNLTANAQKDDGDNCDCDIGDPINYGSGNHHEVMLDYQGQGAFPLHFQRFYNSRAATNTVFGTNWRHNYSAAIQFIPGTAHNTAIVLRPNGRSYTYTQNGTTWSSDADVNDRLTTTADGNGTILSASYTTAQHEIETYDGTGRLLSIQSRPGVLHTLTYETTGLQRLISISDPFGHQLGIQYDSSNRVSVVTDPNQQQIQYGYDNNNRLTSVTYPSANTRIYRYNEAAHTGGADLPQALTSVQDENGTLYTVWNYDSAGRAIGSAHAGGVEQVNIVYNADGTRNITGSLGHTRTMSLQNILGISKNTGLSEFCSDCQDGTTASKTHDVNGNVTSRTDFNGTVTTYTYDLTRNLETSRTEAAGTPQARTITTAWHPTYRLPLKIAEPNRRTTFTHDANGNVLTKTVQATTGAQAFSSTLTGAADTWTTTYNAVGQVLTIDGPRTDATDKTTYAYDNSGNLATIANAAGHVTTLSNYDAHGHAGRIVDPNGIATDLTYHPRGWLASSTVTDSTAIETTTYVYDGVGQLTGVTLPKGTKILYTYDDAHRLTAIADSLGNKITYTLDNMGNRINEQVKDPGGALARQTSRLYDALNRLQQVTGGAQ